jgi:hypothetical protein
MRLTSRECSRPPLRAFYASRSQGGDSRGGRDSSCKLAQGCANGSKNAAFEIREATQSHAFKSPVPGECRSTNGPADGEQRCR